ncbi:MAG: sialate O-acetylesterase [Terriglobales bacterium]
MKYSHFSLLPRPIPGLFLLAVLCGLVSPSGADPLLPHLLADHMVLQQDRPIHIWGKADPEEQITITLADKTVSVLPDASGNWSVRLPAMHAGGPFTIVVRGNKTIFIKDVMIGEVWVASGQSNMTFALSDSVGAAEEIPKADYPQIRLFVVPKKIALEAQSDTLPAAWEICSPETAKTFSAVAYYFARDLRRKLNVPIGIIESAWPGTTIEEWIDSKTLQETPALKSIADQWDGSSPAKAAEAIGRRSFNLQFDDFELIRDPSSPGTLFSNFDDGTSRNTMGGEWSYSWQDAPKTSFDLVAPGRGGAGFAATVAGKVDASDGSRLTAHFKADHSAADLSSYAGIRFWVRGDGSFRVRTLQPTITDVDDYGTTLFQASSDWKPVVILFRDLRQEGWGVTEDFTVQSLTGFAIESFPGSDYPPRPPSGLYGGMITPLEPYSLRGVIWYQGESNALEAYQYRKLLPALIESWRGSWNQGDFPFLIVQLPNHGAIPEKPSESAWAELREAQFLTTKQIPNTEIAVTIDIGDPKNVHPHRKAEVGQRLALLALGTTYKKPIVYSGPLYQSMTVERNKIRIRFKNTGSGMEARGGGPLIGFAIAGADQDFRWAEAAIDGVSVVVSSPEVLKPVAVRYAWGDSPRCNLFNKDGLPASPFRTDSWPGITLKAGK